MKCSVCYVRDVNPKVNRSRCEVCIREARRQQDARPHRLAKKREQGKYYRTPTYYQAKTILAEQVICCVYCGERASSPDHVYGLGQVGEEKYDSLMNMLPACHSCNSGRASSGLSASDYMIRKGRGGSFRVRFLSEYVSD